jgi:hypothetical protein
MLAKNGANVEAWDESWQRPMYYVTHYEQTASNDKLKVWQNHGGISPRPLPGRMDRLETDDSVRVVWSASSGGKTQTLFKYTVQ